MGVIAKEILRGYQGLFTPVSLGYPLSVFNKNSTLKERKKESNCNETYFKRRRGHRDMRQIPTVRDDGVGLRGAARRLLPNFSSVKMVFLELFCKCSAPRDQTATWQCCCGVGGFSATTQPWLRVQTHRKVRHGQTGVWVASSRDLLLGGADRGIVCRKFFVSVFFLRPMMSCWFCYV